MVKFDISALIHALAALFHLSAPTTPHGPTPNKSYDFVIVGGGTAGCVLAARLTENPKTNVLLIEAGESPEGNINTVVPFLGVTLPNTAVDWNYTTTGQTGYNGRSIPYPRGYALGGSSTINLMTWNRGSDALWDHWGDITGDSTWKWNNIEQYYFKVERLVAPADGHNMDGEVIPSAHGHGPVGVSVASFGKDFTDRIVNASKALGGQFRFNQDLNSGDSIGFNVVQSSIVAGKRSSALTGYLNSTVINRPNLDIMLNTRVTRLIKTGTTGGLPEFKAVEVSQDPSKPSVRTQFKATKEVIMSAGSIGTPQILLLSGIGPKADLQKLKLDVVVDHPDVGQNLTDHALLPNYFAVNSNSTFDDVLRNPNLFNSTLQSWSQNSQGLFADAPANTQGYYRIPPNATIFKTVQDPTPYKTSAHTEVIFVNGFAAFGAQTQPDTGNFMTVVTILVSPTARGSVTLASTNIYDQPNIDPNFLGSDFDIFAMVQAMKDSQTFITSTPFGGFVKGSIGELANAKDDNGLSAYARKFSSTTFHPAGTAKMSPVKASWGVVDPDMTMKKVSGIRVVDASVYPQLPQSHPASAAYIVAEKAADIIKAKYKL